MIELLQYLATILTREELKVVSYIIKKNPRLIDKETFNHIKKEVKEMEKEIRKENKSLKDLLKDNDIEPN